MKKILILLSSIGIAIAIAVYFYTHVPIKFVGEYELIGNYTETINGKETTDDLYWQVRTFEQLMNTCTDQPQDYADFIKNCIQFSEADKAKLSKLLEDKEIIVSKVPIKKIRRHSEYTKRDQCDYWMEFVEVVVDKSKQEPNKVYLYSWDLNEKYRLVPCP